jgi:hypothetical protein
MKSVTRIVRRVIASGAVEPNSLAGPRELQIQQRFRRAQACRGDGHWRRVAECKMTNKFLM